MNVKQVINDYDQSVGEEVLKIANMLPICVALCIPYSKNFDSEKDGKCPL